MANVTIKMKDGTINEFIERGRPGGSWCVSVRYEGAFVIVEDEWGKTTAYPACDVASVVKDAPSRGW